MMASADEVIVVVDSTKFGRTSLARLCELGNVDTLVVDDGISEHWREKIIDAGVKLVVAESDDAPPSDDSASAATAE